MFFVFSSRTQFNGLSLIGFNLFDWFGKYFGVQFGWIAKMSSIGVN